MSLRVFSKLVITLTQYFGVFQCQVIVGVIIELIDAYQGGTRALDPIITRLNHIMVSKELAIGYLAYRYKGEPKTLTLTNTKWGTTLMFELDDTGKHLSDISTLSCGKLNDTHPDMA